MVRRMPRNQPGQDRSRQCRSALPLGFGMLGAAIAVVLVAACSPIDQPLRSDLQRSDVQQCAAWFVRLDDAIDRAAVRDAEAYRVPGYPYLRVNRFLASFRDQAQGDPAAFAVWERHLRDLDARARAYELSNLPLPSLVTLGVTDRPAATAITNRCSDILATLDLGSPAARETLAARAEVPDDYADWKRAVGLYPVVRWPFFEFAKGWERQTTGMFQLAALGNAEGPRSVRYQPPDNGLTAAQVTELLVGTKRDALGIPVLSPRERAALIATFAPVFAVETNGDYDRIGPLQWTGGEAPTVDVSRLTVFQRLAFTRYGQQTLVQLVYSIWFPERPKTGLIDAVSGTLDGLTFRVTLDPSGHPLVYDSIHNCGCYHMFFPTPRVTAVAAADASVEWAFIPRQLPAIDAPQRILVRITSGNHYLTDVLPDTGGHGLLYSLVDDGELRTLPIAGGTRSAFDPDGIVPGTDRGERFVTWTLGLDDAGAMHEWGHHATALIGRRQFDDADLIERRFAIVGLADAQVPSPAKPE